MIRKWSESYKLPLRRKLWRKKPFVLLARNVVTFGKALSVMSVTLDFAKKRYTNWQRFLENFVGCREIYWFFFFLRIKMIYLKLVLYVVVYWGHRAYDFIILNFMVLQNHLKMIRVCFPVRIVRWILPKTGKSKTLRFKHEQTFIWILFIQYFFI